MRIGTIFHPDFSNVVYRAIWPLEALEERGHEVLFASTDFGRDATMAEARACDLVHIYRRADAGIQRVAEALSRRGTAITWDNDDDLRLAPPGTEPHRFATSLAGHHDIRASIRMRRRADIVTTTSAPLAELFRRDGAQAVEVLENFTDRRQLVEPREHDGIVIGWAARAEHELDARALDVAGALRTVLDADPRVRVETVGIRLDGLPPDRYRWTPPTTLDALTQTYGGWDIGLAPIRDLPMNAARSNIKAKEYAAAGLAWLASARGPYPAACAPGSGGVLVADDAWAATLLDLLATDRWATLREDARAWGAAQLIEHHAGGWERVFEQAVERRRPLARA